MTDSVDKISTASFSPGKVARGVDIPMEIELGIGYNWFDFFGLDAYYARWKNYPLNTPVCPDLQDQAGWDALLAGLDELNPGWLRFGLPPDPHVDPNGKPIFDTDHVRRLERVAEWAASRGKPIVLDFFVIPEFYEFPRPEGTTNPGDILINMAAADNRAFARDFVVPFVHELVVNRGLSAIKYFNPVNEPMEYGVYQTPEDGPPVIVHYVDMYRELRTAFDKCGVTRERLGLIGMDTIEPTDRILEMHAHGVDIDPYIDAYSVHHYNIRLDHWPPAALPDTGPSYFDNGIGGVIEREDFDVLVYCRRRNKPLWNLEMGTFYFGKFSNPAGVASWPACIAVGEAIIRAANIGIGTFCLWSLLNANNVDGHWAVLSVEDGRWRGEGHPFRVYRELGRHLIPGATVIPASCEEDIRPRHAYGSWSQSESHLSLMLLNDHDEEARSVVVRVPDTVEITTDWIGCCTTQHQVEHIHISRADFAEGKLDITLPPSSILRVSSVGEIGTTSNGIKAERIEDL